MTENKIALVVFGNIPSKANKYLRGRGKSFYKDSSVVVFEQNALMQLNAQLHSIRKYHKLPLTAKLRVEYTFEVSGWEKDGDNMEKTINDILQKSGVIKNDKQIKNHSTAIKDKATMDKTIAMIYYTKE